MNKEFDWHYQHLHPFTLKDKAKYLDSAWAIQNSFTGIAEFISLHRFFIEAAVEIKNSVKLFEDGFIGPAFYNVRTAVELARVVTLFATDSNYVSSEIFNSWKAGGKFPFDSKIKKDILTTSEAYREIEELLADFFSAQADYLKKMQKYIHKQGFITFYERGFETNEKAAKRIKKITADFEIFIENSLIEIAILRLCVDPLPIMLNDPDLYRRIHVQFMTVPFSEELMNLIGTSRIQSLRSTEYYLSRSEYFRQFEELSDEALTVVNDNYYDRNHWHTIEPQLSLLSIHDRIAIILFQLSENFAKVYTIGGLHQYNSNISTKRKDLSWSSGTFDVVRSWDVPYDEAYLSYIKLHDEEYWIEHNASLTKNEKEILNSVAASLKLES